jgi:hypothetical protein
MVHLMLPAVPVIGTVSFNGNVVARQVNVVVELAPCGADTVPVIVAVPDTLPSVATLICIETEPV